MSKITNLPLAAITAGTLIALAAGPVFGQPPKDLVNNTDELLNLSEPKTIFVTSMPTPSGDLGGLEGADAICQGLADALGSIVPEGEYVALLSTEEVHASARITPSIGPYIRPDGAYVTANAAALFSTFLGIADTPPGRLINSPRIDEMGADHPASRVWTGTRPNGTVNAGVDDCSGWEDGTGLLSGVIGQPGSLGGFWLFTSDALCDDDSNHLYCVMR